MPDKYHISPTTGLPNKCRAQKRPCPVGGPNSHYPTKEAAIVGQERKNRIIYGDAMAGLRKQNPAGEATKPKRTRLSGTFKDNADGSWSLPADGQHFRGPKPLKAKIATPNTSKETMVEFCSNCGETTERGTGYDGYSGCCNEPVDSEAAEEVQPPTYEMVFASPKEGNEFIRSNSRGTGWTQGEELSENRGFKVSGSWGGLKLKYKEHTYPGVARPFRGETRPETLTPRKDGGYDAVFRDGNEIEVFCNRNGLFAEDEEFIAGSGYRNHSYRVVLREFG